MMNRSINRTALWLAPLAVLALGACAGKNETGSPSEPTVSDASDKTEGGEEAQAIMPEVVCLDLQTAQDTIQEAGVFFSRSHDATGRDRMQLLDSNWQVVAQTPAPGTPIGELEAVLDVVKYGEPSPVDACGEHDGAAAGSDDQTVVDQPENTDTADEPAAEEAQAIMPDVVCLDLQTAQDTIQEAGVFFSRSHDATGRDRMQLLDSNWQVVAQTPAPGTPIGELEAVLDVVKYGEPSPVDACGEQDGAAAGSDDQAVVDQPDDTDTADEPAAEEAQAIMPDVVCLDLQTAQDTIQEAGVFFSRSHDATGGRPDAAARLQLAGRRPDTGAGHAHRRARGSARRRRVR